ncbi:hypothetical protein D3C81_771620 [compost metagenome]
MVTKIVDMAMKSGPRRSFDLSALTKGFTGERCTLPTPCTDAAREPVGAAGLGSHGLP